MCSHAGRLEDKSANVRKAALQLLATLLLNNPFGPQLPADKFTVSLEEHKQRLKVWSTADCTRHSLGKWLRPPVFRDLLAHPVTQSPLRCLQVQELAPDEDAEDAEEAANDENVQPQVGCCLSRHSI